MPSRVDSRGRRNTAYVTGSEELVQSLGRCSPAKGLSRPAVEGHRHGCKVLGAVHAEVSALREVLAQQPIGVLVRAALPGAVGIAEVDLKTSIDPQAGVLALRPQATSFSRALTLRPRPNPRTCGRGTVNLRRRGDGHDGIDPPHGGPHR